MLQSLWDWIVRNLEHSRNVTTTEPYSAIQTFVKNQKFNFHQSIPIVRDLYNLLEEETLQWARIIITASSSCALDSSDRWPDANQQVRQEQTQTAPFSKPRSSDFINDGSDSVESHTTTAFNYLPATIQWGTVGTSMLCRYVNIYIYIYIYIYIQT